MTACQACTLASGGSRTVADAIHQRPDTMGYRWHKPVTISPGLNCRVKRAIASLAVISGLLWLDGRLGPISFPLRRVSACALLAILLLGVVRPRGRLASTFALGVTVALVAVAPTVPLALLAFTLAVAIAGRLTSHASPLATGLAQACFTYLGLRFLSDLLPQSRVLGDILSVAAHNYLRITTGTNHHLSPTALGGVAVVALAVFLLWRWRLSKSRAQLLGAAMVPVAWFLLLPILFVTPPDGPVSIFARGAWFGVFWIACAAIVDAAAPRIPDLTGVGMPRFLSMCGCVASLLIGMTLVGAIFRGGPAKPSILVHNRGGLDWDRPVFGEFGQFSGGMFGLLPVYARANGYRFEIHDQDTVTASTLSGAQILVLINSPKEWEGEELRTVRDFVAGGGSLLVLGDHTDVFGLMKGFNTLLAGFGMLFQFDSAYHARSTWRGCVSAAPDAVSCGWDMKIPSVAVGASLKLQGWSRPLLCGRYAHSDLGLRSNIVGSFLGNYAYDQGEELGDVVLVASATHGRGRVIVFGDTSPFQGGLSESFPQSVGPVLRLLSRPTCAFERPTTRLIMAAFLVAILLGLWTFAADNSLTAVFALMLCGGVAAGWMASRSQLHSPVSVGPDCFLVDHSHLPAVGHYRAKVNPTGPLHTNLLRCGLRVARFDKWDRTLLSQAKGIAFVAPQSPFTPAEIQDLLRFEQAGGVVLLAAGQPDATASRPLVLAHGLDLEARPLGTVPSAGVGRARQDRERPRFLDAWPIVSTSGKDLATVPEVDILYRAGNDVTALFCRHGRGGLLFISDSRFFSSMNVEGTWGHWVGNLALIHDMFQTYLAVDPDAVGPLFRSPKKPD